MMLRRLVSLRVAALAGAATAASRASAEDSSTSHDGSTIAAAYVDNLSTSDGQKYTLAYLDRSTRFSVWKGNGERSSMSELMASAATQDVVVLGETHYDAVGHKLQEVIFSRLAAARPITLALEMFETDVQHILDEYLHGLIREQDMLKDARAWPNYDAHYRPLVELVSCTHCFHGTLETCR